MNRPPTARDDENSGYRPGSLWRCEAGDFVALRTATGQAVWQARHFVSALLDQLHGPRPLAAYAMTRLAAGVVTPCLDVVRPADGATATIGFTAAGRFDRAAFARFLGDAAGRVTRWYDQSGHERHATADVATAPALTLSAAPTLVFDSVDAPGQPARRCFMEIPDGLRVRLDSCSAFACGRSLSSLKPSVFFQLGGPGTPAPVIVGGCLPGSPQVSASFGAVLAPSGRLPTQALRVAGVTILPDRAHVIHDDDGFTTLAVTPDASFAGIARGGLIGGCDAGLTGHVELASLVVLDGPVFGPGDPNHDAIRACQYAAMGIVPQIRDLYVADGDSITEGIGASHGASYPRQMEALLGHAWRIHNCGISGDTLAGRDQAYAARIAPFCDPRAARRVLSIFAATNDLALGADAASLAAHLRSYCARARATGFRVIVATTLPRPDLSPGQGRQLHAHNAFIRQDWRGFCDGVADVAADPVFAGTAIYADGLHPTSLGHAHIAQIMAGAVDALAR